VVLKRCSVNLGEVLRQNFKICEKIIKLLLTKTIEIIDNLTFGFVVLKNRLITTQYKYCYVCKKKSKAPIVLFDVFTT